MNLETAIGHPLKIHGIASGDELRRRVVEALDRVGLSPAQQFLEKYPSDLSGGQKQRAVIARAIILGPEMLVADEPISMLDMSVRAKILELMLDLKRDLGLTYVYITHDLATAKFFCDRVAIMYLGRIVETGTTSEIFDNPRHPYTQALLRAVPDPDPSRGVARDLPRGEVPDAADPPAGCSFHPRCPQAFAPCGWQARDVRMILEQRWTTVEPEQYQRELAQVGDPERFSDDDTRTGGIIRPQSGSPDQLLDLLQQERDSHPDEPLWKGVRGLEADNGAVRVDFAERYVPALLPVVGSSVEVACHLYHDPSASD
jgi:peptide/nickel transport system ATP-binding protein